MVNARKHANAVTMEMRQIMFGPLIFGGRRGRPPVDGPAADGGSGKSRANARIAHGVILSHYYFHVKLFSQAPAIDRRS